MSDVSRSRYTSVAIALHWAMAALLIFMILLGWAMEDNEARFQLHKSVGITILFLALARLGWRFANPPPSLPEGMAPLEKTASHAVHVAFYALMIGVPLVGWFMVSVSPFQVSTVLYGVLSWPHLPFTDGLRSEAVYGVAEFFHSKSAWLIFGLLALHVAGAVKHEIGAEDGVLKRMLPGLFGKTEPPALPGRGFIFAFGGSLLLFAVIAVASMLGSGGNGGAKSQTAPRIEGNWDVDYSASEIRFDGAHEGRGFGGVFGAWTADVAFYPDDLERSAVQVVIDTRSIRTGTKLYDDNLRGKEWFNPGEFPEAVVELSDFAEAAGGYTATATITLKGSAVRVPLGFTLDIAGDEARLSGSAELSRKALDLGQSSDPGAAYVADEVTVTLSGKATRRS